MGTHYFNLDYGNKTACKKDMPLMLLYIDNNLNGFAWQHMAPLNTTGTDWEIFNIQAKLYIPSTVNTDYILWHLQYSELSIISMQQILFFLRNFSCLHALLQPTRLLIFVENSHLHNY